MAPTPGPRRAGLATAAAAIPVALAYRFALVYRVRAGYPKRHPLAWTPAGLGLAYETVELPTLDGVRLRAWWIPAGRDAAPAVVLIHGWDSARDRTLPHALFLHAAGFHVLTLDVRGHGENGPETLPVSAGEFAADAAAGVAFARGRTDVTRIALLGHSIGAAGALVAASRDPSLDAVVAVAAPATPDRLTRQTFRLAELPIPSPIAWPLAWLTTRVFLRPRGHAVPDISATAAVRVISAPVLLIQGDDDHVVPPDHLDRLASARRAALPGAVTETVRILGGHHSWLYEFAEFRGAVARFLAGSLGGPLTPDGAARAAEASPAVRLPEPERLSALDEEPGGVRSLLGVFRRQSPTGSVTTPVLAINAPPARPQPEPETA